MNKFEEPLCNFCKISDYTIIAKNNNGVYDFGSIKKDSIYKTEYDFVECNRCGLRYFTPRMTEEYIYSACGYDGDTVAGKERAELYFNTGVFGGVLPEGYTVQQQKDFLYTYYGSHLKMIEGYLGRKIKSLFEIGSSVGFTLEAAKRYGIDIAHGCDCDFHSVRIVKNVGYNVEHCFFRNYLPKMSYDVILSYNCIEHTFTPFEDIQKTFNMLNVGGIHLLHTFFEDIDVEKKMFAPCGHWYHFFEKTLRMMLESVGFKILNVSKSGFIGFFICQK